MSAKETKDRQREGQYSCAERECRVVGVRHVNWTGGGAWQRATAQGGAWRLIAAQGAEPAGSLAGKERAELGG